MTTTKIDWHFSGGVVVTMTRNQALTLTEPSTHYAVPKSMRAQLAGYSRESVVEALVPYGFMRFELNGSTRNANLGRLVWMAATGICELTDPSIAV